MPDAWLTKAVANAWTDAFCPWRRGIAELRDKFEIDPVKAVAKSQPGFKRILKKNSAHQCLKAWEKSRGAHVVDRCEAACGQAREKNVNVAQAYVCLEAAGGARNSPQVLYRQA